MAYSFYSEITIDATKVPGDLANFPVLISGTYDGTGGEPDIRLDDNGGNVQNTASGGASGSYTVPADLVFSPNTDGSSEYDHEIEKYSATSGEIISWVEITALSGTQNTVLYMCYGDSGVTTSQEDVAGTWDSNFKGVWHLGEASGTFYDSTSNGKDGIDYVSATGKTGQIGNGQEFDGSDDYINCGNLGSFANHTVEAWVRGHDVEGTTDGYPYWSRITFTWNNYNAFMYTNPAGSHFILAIYGNAGSVVGFTGSNNTWYYTAQTHDGTTGRVYEGGAEYSNFAVGGTIVFDEFKIGKRSGGYGTPFDGEVDEVRVSNIARTANYITTTYNTQNDPSTFYSVGAEQAVTQTLEPTGIASAEAFGSPQLNLKLAATGIATAVAFGVAVIISTIAPTAIASAEAFGTAQLNLKLEPAGIASAEAFGSAQLNLKLEPAGIASGEAFGTATVGQLISPTGIASAEAIGSPIVAGPITVTGIGSAEAFGSAQLNLKLEPAGIASAEAFGSAQLNLKLEPAGIASGEVFGAAQLNLILEPTGIGSAEAIGSPVVVGPIIATGIASAEAFGTAQINLKLEASGIASAEAFGSAQLNLKLEPAGIASAEAFGTLSIGTLIEPAGIASAEAFGTASIAITISPTGIASAEAFGTPYLFETIPLKITINDVDRTLSIDRDTIRIVDVLGKQVNTASFALRGGGAMGLAELQEVIISSLDGGTRYFAGYIQTKEEIEGQAGYDLDYEIECVDYSWDLEHPEALVDGTYTSKSDQWIIQNAVAACIPDIDCTTYVEEVKADTVSREYVQQKPWAVLDDLAALAGAEWYVDYGPGPGAQNAYLHYFDAGTNVAPFSLSDSPDLAASFPYKGLHEITEAPQANKVLVIGAGTVTATRTRGAEEDYGRWIVDVLKDNNITTTAQAEERGDAFLLAAAAAPSYTLTTRRPGLRSGQDVTLVNAVRSIDAAFEIKKVTTKFIGGGHASFAVEMGKYISSLSDLFRGMAELVDVAPAAPTGLSVSTGTAQDDDGHWHSYLNISWSANSELDMGGYDVKWVIGGNTSTKRVPESQTAEYIFPVDSHVAYSVQVQAVDMGGNPSGYCTAATGTTAKDTIAPAIPANLTVTAAKKAIRIKVDKNTEGDWAGNEFHVSTSNGFTPSASTLVHSGKSTAHTYQTASYVAHYVKVRAYDTASTPNYSAYTAQGSATPQQIDAPSDVPANNIPSGQIISLAATKITAGTLQAGVVYAGSVAANKITAGTFVAGVIYAGDIECTQIKAGTITAAISIQSAGTIGFVNGPQLYGSGTHLVCSGDLWGAQIRGSSFVAATFGTICDSLGNIAGASYAIGATGIVDSSRHLKNVTLDANWDVGAYQIRALTFYSDQSTIGGPPLTVLSTTKVTNLNADYVDSRQPGTGVGDIAYYDASGRVADSQLVDGKEPGTIAGKIAYYDANIRVLDSVKWNGCTIDNYYAGTSAATGHVTIYIGGTPYYLLAYT